MRFFTIVILTGIFCLCYSQIVQSAEMKVVDNSVLVNIDFYEVHERSVWDSGKRSELTATGVRKQTLNAHPPPSGQTVLQYLLTLPAVQVVSVT